MRWRNAVLWGVALGVTLASAVYQRLTGPTYPVAGSLEVGGSRVSYRLPRSHGGPSDPVVVVQAPDTSVGGVLVYRRYRMDEGWTRIQFQRRGGRLIASLPHQPAAAKLEYRLELRKGTTVATVPAEKSVIIRFKEAVPAAVLIPHIVLMFSAMLVSTRAGLEALRPSARLRAYALWATGLLFLGGLLIGAIVQKYAFGVYWTGVPFGLDWTDNKTLIAFLVWGAAAVATRKGRSGRGWVLAAAVVTLVIFAIPHSLG